MNEQAILGALAEVLEARKTATADASYVASLYTGGLNKILEKVGEEAIEVVLAAKDSAETDDKSHLVAEVADLWFHTLVLLAHQQQSPDAVLRVLAERFGIGGHEEKAARGQ